MKVQINHLGETPHLAQRAKALFEASKCGYRFYQEHFYQGAMSIIQFSKTQEPGYVSNRVLSDMIFEEYDKKKAELEKIAEVLPLIVWIGE